MGFVWIGEKLFKLGNTDMAEFNLPDWAVYVILGVMLVAIGGLVVFMFTNSRASAIINFIFMAANVFLMFFSFEQKKFVNPYELQLASMSDFRADYAAGTWIWGMLVFALASLSITANIHTFFTDGRYEQLYIDRFGRFGSETRGLDESQKCWLAFGIILAVSAGAVALGLYKNMWWLQGYSIGLLALSVIQIIVTFVLHEQLDEL